MIELFAKAKEKGINTTIDTSGAPFTREEPFFGKFNELMKYTDLLLVDIKHIDDEQHKLSDRAYEQEHPGYGALSVGYRETGVDPARSCPGEKRQRRIS